MNHSGIRLDWSRLLGFDQVDPSTCVLEGAKPGDAMPSRIGSKVGVPKIGAKVGVITKRPS